MGGIKYINRCANCGRTEEVKDSESVPLCCSREMVKDTLDQCIVPDNPEMVRNYNTGEPCDDGRGKENKDR